jgi:uncharacterized membrane protein YecN with MAPEG domain
MPYATALYAGLLGLMSIVLAFIAGSIRGRERISVGDGGNKDLLLAMRRHANFTEFVPLALVLLAVLELNGVSKLAIHCLGAGLVVSRICHAVGLKADSIEGVGRAVGAGGTALVTAVASVWAIVVFF